MVPERNAEQLGEAIAQLLENDEAALKRGERARERVEEQHNLLTLVGALETHFAGSSD